MFDLDTILKAIQIVGATTEVGHRLYADFVALTSGETQQQLKDRYAAARERSDALHTAIQQDLGSHEVR